MARQKFEAPKANPYTEAQPQEQPKSNEIYRFNAKFPIECKAYLQEMAWRNRTTTTEYLARLVLADMEAHPNWKDSLDALNT